MFKKIGLSILVTTMILVLLPWGSVHAAPSFDDPNPQAGKDGYPRLVRAYKKLQELYSAQEKFLARADDGADKAQTMIDKALEKGLDMSALQSALDDFKKSLVESNVAHRRAGEILNGHAGFDENGMVIDVALARETVKDAASALKDARQAHLGAGRTLRKVIRDFLVNNKDLFPNQDEGKWFGPIH